MIQFVLDTDTLSLLLRRHPVVCEHASQHKTETAITVLTVEEQLSGWYGLLRKSRNADKLIEASRSLADSVRFLSQLQIIDYDAAALARYEQLKGQKLNIGRFDMRIAAVVLECGAALVTRNARDFTRVPGLRTHEQSRPIQAALWRFPPAPSCAA